MTIPNSFYAVLIAVLAVVRLAGAGVHANALADQTPDDAVVFIGFAGTQSLQSEYGGSPLKAALEQSNFLDIAGRLRAAIGNSASQDDQSTAVIRTIDRCLPLLMPHPCAFYLRPGDDKTPLHFGLLCKADSDLQALQAALTSAGENIPDLHLDEISTPDGKLLCWSDQAYSAGSTVLAKSPVFTAAMGARGDRAAVSVFVDAKSLLGFVDTMAAHHPEDEVAAAWPKLREALGISGMQSLAMTAGFDGNFWITDGQLLSTGARKGLLAVIEPKPIDPVLLARVPATATSVSVVNFDAAAFYDTLADAAAVSPRTDTLFHQVSGVLSIGLGRNLRRVILGSLGPQWVTYTDARSHTTMVLNHPRDADNAGDAMVSATFGIVNTVNAQFPQAGNGSTASVVQKTIDKMDLTWVDSDIARPIADQPAFGVKDGVLYFGFSPKAVVDAANTAAAGDHDFLHDEDFSATLYRLHVPTAGSIDYCDVPKTAPRALAMWHDHQQQLDQLLQLADEQMPPVKWPEWAGIGPKLSPALSVRWGDEKGIYWRSTSAMPGSELLAGDTELPLAFANTASVLIPAVQKAIAQANRVRNEQHARDLVMAALIYSTRHQGKFPPDLPTLVSDTADLRMFQRSPATARLPDDLATVGLDQKKKWVSEHADFVWVLPSNFDGSNAPTTAMVVETHLGKTDTQAAVGYADGHADVISSDEARSLIAGEKK